MEGWAKEEKQEEWAIDNKLWISKIEILN